MPRLRNIKQLNKRIFDYVNSDYHDALLIAATAQRRVKEIVDVSVVPLHSKKDLIAPCSYYFAYKIDDRIYWTRNMSPYAEPKFIKICKKDYWPLLRACVTLPADALDHGMQIYVVKPGYVAMLVPIR